MATLILDHDGQQRGAVLNGRTVIGRRANSHVVIRDRSVSRVHAWIGRAGHTFFVADSGSRTGTIVNGRPVEGRRSLRDGDQIRIGPATITFLSAAELPPGVEPLPSPGEPVLEDDGIFVYCQCGAPIWAPWEFGGRTGRCRHCGKAIALPGKSGNGAPADLNNETVAGGIPAPLAPATGMVARLSTEAAPARAAESAPKSPPLSARIQDTRGPLLLPEPPARSRIADLEDPPRTEMICGACQSPISTLEATTTCPDCGIAFHADCWTENRGCSSYGCKQVGVLDPQPAAAVSAYPAYEGAEVDEPRRARSRLRAVNWEPLVLPASALVGLAGVLAFGVPSLAIVAGLVVWSTRRPPKNRKLLAAATIVSSLMAAAGSALSTYWWLRP